MEINIIAPVGTEDVNQAMDIMGLMPEFLNLENQGYKAVYAEGNVATDIDRWGPDMTVAALRSAQERGLAKMQAFLEADPGESYKMDSGEHQLEDGTRMFWYIISKVVK